MRTCIDNRKRKVFNDIKHLSTKAVLLIIFLSLLPALQVMAMETPDETQQKSTIRVQGRVLDEFNQPLPGVSILAVKSTKGVISRPLKSTHLRDIARKQCPADFFNK